MARYFLYTPVSIMSAEPTCVSRKDGHGVAAPTLI